MKVSGIDYECGLQIVNPYNIAATAEVVKLSQLDYAGALQNVKEINSYPTSGTTYIAKTFRLSKNTIMKYRISMKKLFFFREQLFMALCQMMLIEVN